jgi:peptidoglycan/xylan/chitin deacetylase (PgdA/CDA1 family)
VKILTAGAIAAILQGIALPALADINVGAYLAARQARYLNDFDAAAQYYTQALTRDASNPVILESTAIAFMALGEIDRAVPVARQIEQQDLQSQVAFMALIAEDVAAGNHDAVIERIEAGKGVGQLADGLVMAWTELARGDVDAALARFDEVSEERGLKNFALYHKALALASVGDFEAAQAIFSGGDDDAPLQRTRRGTRAWAAVLSQLERNDEAAAMIRESGWDICCHGWRWVNHFELSEAEERDHIARAVESLTRTTGETPAGWYCRHGPSVHTRRLVVEHGGFLYDSDSYADELPYWTEVAGRSHLVVPYSLATNDSKFSRNHFPTGDDYFTFVKDAIDMLWAEGAETPRMMSCGLHLRLIGHPSRAAGLARLLDYVQEKGGIWVTGRRAIAEHWIREHPHA